MLYDLAFVLIVVVVAGGLGYWANIGMKVTQMIVFSLVTVMFIVTVYFGAYSIIDVSGQGKGYFAIAAAAFTLGLTIFGECFNTPLEKCEKIKLRSSQWKAGINIFRAFTIFVCTAVYFLP